MSYWCPFVVLRHEGNTLTIIYPYIRFNEEDGNITLGQDLAQEVYKPLAKCTCEFNQGDCFSCYCGSEKNYENSYKFREYPEQLYKTTTIEVYGFNFYDERGPQEYIVSSVPTDPELKGAYIERQRALYLKAELKTYYYVKVGFVTHRYKSFEKAQEEHPSAPLSDLKMKEELIVTKGPQLDARNYWLVTFGGGSSFLLFYEATSDKVKIEAPMLPILCK